MPLEIPVFKDTPFVSLMQKRVFNVLLLGTKYDLFALEEDGRIDEQVFAEYASLGLRYPPRFTKVQTEEEAMQALDMQHFELIICMPNMAERDAFASAKNIKRHHKDATLVVLTPFSHEVSRRMAKEDLSDIDYVFSWLGDADLLLAIIKLVEDKWNFEQDARIAAVRCIILVEDSIRFYSAVLPHLYRIVLEQSQEIAKEALNDQLKTLRKRGRPKILLARSYEEAIHLLEAYGEYVLGVVSDMSFHHNGEKDELAGYHLGKVLRNYSAGARLILESSEEKNATYAKELGVAFIPKNSRRYAEELRREMERQFGMGDFRIIDPRSHKLLYRVHTLHELQTCIMDIPDDAMRYHLKRNDFSRFFFSRVMFEPALVLIDVDVSQYADMDEARQFVFDLIVAYRHLKNEGVVAIFQADRFDRYAAFARIGRGSLGGKGRGLAFMAAMIRRYGRQKDTAFSVDIPKTVVLCTDVFDRFIQNNQLQNVAFSDATDERIFKHFQKAHFPTEIHQQLSALLDVIKAPIAVRSSSLLEDSHYQPFAGIYSTFMIPYSENKQERLRQLLCAIKAVYASVYFKKSKAYLQATRNLVEEEKMAIVLQEVIGLQYGKYFYPTLSGVARSLNFYPLNGEKPEDGVASIALGLGKYIVDNYGKNLQFSPKHPRRILQLSQPELALRDCQTHFLALNLQHPMANFQLEDDFNLSKLDISQAEEDGVLKLVCSTYDSNDHRLRPGFYPNGRKLITFQNLIENEQYPIAQTISRLLDIGKKEMGRNIEIEFATTIDLQTRVARFSLLQMRPIVDVNNEVDDTQIDALFADRRVIVSSNQALGNGTFSDIRYIAYVKKEVFDPAQTPHIVAEVAEINRHFSERDYSYILVGPGRWGSSDPWLGIPVDFADINRAELIVECAYDNYRVEPSQGTHFFQNITSLGIGYMCVDDLGNHGLFYQEKLDKQPSVLETEHLRVVEYENPLQILINGRSGKGIVVENN
ncbi:MAG: phosphoenolpyruvate synthase [Alloprevotella sp.]|nr:phosphoenolpyruvate synthase [Alloprevotella sp.]